MQSTSIQTQSQSVFPFSGFSLSLANTFFFLSIHTIIYYNWFYKTTQYVWRTILSTFVPCMVFDLLSVSIIESSYSVDYYGFFWFFFHSFNSFLSFFHSFNWKGYSYPGIQALIFFCFITYALFHTKSS
jgi:hypothetical protein